MALTPRRAALLVGIVAFLAYVPILDGGFIDFDDDRFVTDNPAVHRLDLAQVTRFFTDPSTLAEKGWRGTWRPLRTLEFAVDWAISGGEPWFFHLRNVLYHVLGSLLVLALFLRLSKGEVASSVLGALLFAVHPVQVEAVAWITSRGDTMLLVTFLSALLLHLSGRRLGAAIMLVLALLSKEAAVVFPAAALLVDRYRRVPWNWKWYGIYAGLAGLFFLHWCDLQVVGEGMKMGHLPHWWGGSYGANLLTVARGILHYAGLAVMPVHLVLDYVLPSLGGFDLGAALGILIVLLAALAVWRGGERVRFAVLWCAITILPVLNLFFTVAIPTAERFLYLPMVGLCFLGGHLFARARRWLALIPILCLLLLTFTRCFDWRDHKHLMEATRRVAVTRGGHFDLVLREHERAYQALNRGDQQGLTRHAEAVVRTTDELFDYYQEHVGSPPQGLIFVKKSNALFLLKRFEESLEAAEFAIANAGASEDDVVVYGHYNAGAALDKLDQPEEAAEHVERAIEKGYDESDLRPIGARLLNAAAAKREEAGELDAARHLYRRSLHLVPETKGNKPAGEGLRRLLK